MGLRERQKRARRSAITKSAMKLFAQQGYSLTTVEQIAEKAEVSATTVFKYFKTKQEILLDLLKEADIQALEEGREKLSSFNDPVEAMCCLDSLITDYELRVMPAELWREMLPLWSQDMPSQLAELNDHLIESLCVELSKLQERGLIRDDVDIPLLAGLLNTYTNHRFTLLTRDPGTDVDAHRRHMRDIFSLIVCGIGVNTQM